MPVQWLHQNTREEMARRTGRPPLGEAKRKHSVRPSFNDAEMDVVDIKSSRAGLTKSEYVRVAALNAEVAGVLSDEEKDLLHELKKLGPNLNQTAHQANAAGYLSVADKAEKCIDGIAFILMKLKKRMGR